MPDILEHLENDHRSVEQLFEQYENTQGDKSAVVAEIFTELQLHTQLEEQILYPVVRNRMANGDEEADHATEEHDKVDGLLEQFRASPDDRAVFDALKDAVTHHVEEEETEMFPQLRESVDQAQLDEMGQQAEAMR